MANLTGEELNYHEYRMSNLTKLITIILILILKKSTDNGPNQLSKFAEYFDHYERKLKESRFTPLTKQLRLYRRLPK